MLKKKEFNVFYFLTALGRPAFKLLVFTVSILAFIIFFLEKVSHFKLPGFALPQILLPNITIPKLKPPHFTIPNIKIKSLALPNFKTIIFSISLLSLTIFSYFELIQKLPDPKQLKNFPSKLTTQILDRNGVILYKIYKDENRTLVSLDDLPSHVKNAFLAAEDKDFYSHNGFSLPGLIRAFQRNILENKTEGGSTITQQLIKNTILTPEKTISRKIKEIILAIKAERIYSKDEIFEMYLNQVGFGGPAYGIQEASRQYFNIDARSLSLSQAAFLAGITRAPSKYSPYGDNPDLSLTRQRIVLDQMHKAKMISSEELSQALTERLTFKTAHIEIIAPHFVMLVKNLLVEELGENFVTQGGLKVYTTLDTTIQDKAQKIVTDEVTKLSSLNVTNGSALVTNPKTGEVLAMVGSTNYFDLNKNGQVNLTTSLRQPGSSIKPLNYALSFENGHNPADIITDKPITIQVSGQENWAPKNYDGRFHGNVTLRQALANSYNIPSVILLLQNGPANFAAFAKKLGISSWDNPQRYGPSMALGSLEVSMIDLATAYSAFANEGITTPLHTVTRIEQPDGKVIRFSGCTINTPTTPSDSLVNAETSICRPKQTISPTTAYLISDILSDNYARSQAFGINSVLNIKNAKVAVKTGTSNDLKDNWTIGFTPDFLIATWVGNNDSSPMSQIASGVTGASPIWAKIVNHMIHTNPVISKINQPENLVKVSICTITGTLTCSGCPTKTDYYVKGTEPRTACNPEEIARILQTRNTNQKTSAFAL